MGLFKQYKFQYHKDQTDEIPYEGREYQAALYEKDGSIARIILNRPDKRNALNDQMFADYLAGLHRARHDPEVKVVIIRGAGPCFSSGHDLNPAESDETPPIAPHLKPSIRDYFNVERRRCRKHEDLMNYPKPTIAQVHGYCIGGAEFIQASCDLTIAAEDAIFGRDGFGRFTVGGVTHFPIWPLGSERFRIGRLGLEISGKDAAEAGLINKAVPLDDLEAEANKWAQALCRLPSGMLMITKELLNGALDITGMGASWRAHDESHIALQFVRFEQEEINFYRTRRDTGMKGFIKEREQKMRSSSRTLVK